MSIRAHRIEEIRTNGASFNLWHDQRVVGWLQRNTSFFEFLNGDCCGLTEVSVEDLKKMLDEVGGEIDPDTKEAINEDIDVALSKGDEYVTYYCF